MDKKVTYEVTLEDWGGQESPWWTYSDLKVAEYAIEVSHTQSHRFHIYRVEKEQIA